MAKHSFLLPDGTTLSSGVPGRAAVQSALVTGKVCDGRELTPGAVCAAMLELTVFAPAGFSVEAGQELTAFRDGEQLGIFVAQQPVRQSAGRYKLTAYDRVSLLDRDLGAWLEGLTDWPYSLHRFAAMVCAACGLELATGEFPNGSYLVEKLEAPGITGRQLMQWVAQAGGCFCRANALGALELGWYEDRNLHIGHTGDAYYYAGTLTREDYTVAPVEQVRLQKSAQDVGTVYPQREEANTLTLTGNYLLSATTAQALEPVARTLFERLQPMTYTPCSLTVPSSLGIRAGDIFTVTDALGVTFTALAMQTRDDGFRCSVSCTGSPRRDSAWAVNEQSYKALSGKVLELRTDVDGIRAENADAAGNLSNLRLQVEGITATVTRQSADTEALQTQLTGLSQTAQAVALTVESIRQEGVSKVRTAADYTFDEKGLRIARTDSRVENLLDNTGMYVSRAGEVILQAGNDGVAAADVQVRNYLTLGDNARLEDYQTGRTACFYIGG